MRLWPGLNHNLTFLKHHDIIRQLFSAGPPTQLPNMVWPLNNNTAHDSLLAMMSQCNANGILPEWQTPSPEEIAAWLEELKETPRKTEASMIHPPRLAEIEIMKRRLATAGPSQDTKEDEAAPAPQKPSTPKRRKRAARKQDSTSSSSANPLEQGLGEALEEEDVVPDAHRHSPRLAPAQAETTPGREETRQQNSKAPAMTTSTKKSKSIAKEGGMWDFAITEDSSEEEEEG